MLVVFTRAWGRVITIKLVDGYFSYQYLWWAHTDELDSL